MQANNHLSIYTIIVTYNGMQWIRKCLNALLQSSVQTKIILVDNASEDETVHIISNEFPSVELIKNKENKGFGAANNIAIKIALQRKADFIFLLNQDAYVQTSAVEKLVLLSNQNKQYGIISPVQLNGNGTTLDKNFKVYLQRVLSDEELLMIEQQQNISKEVTEVRFVNAAAWFIPARAVEATGLFHPMFFHYGEDNNYSSRMQYHGYKVGVALDTFVLHDRNFYIDKQKELFRKIKTIMRYTATDLRKNFLSAYLQAWYKYFSLKKKTSNNISFYTDALREEKDFLLHVEKIKFIRRQTKNAYFE